jgi:ABC-2 type transport system permease protein
MKNVLKKISRSKWWWIPVLILLVVINYAGSIFHSRLDLTSEKRFTISAPVKKLLREYQGNIRIEVFLKGEFPSGFQKLASSTDDLLREFREIAGNRLEYSFISPDVEMPGTGKSYADTLVGMGVQPINLKVQLKAGEQSQYVFPVALVYYGEKMIPVSLYPGTRMVITPSELNSAEAQMEYRFAYAMEKMIRNTRPLIGYTAANGEQTDNRIYDLVENLLKPDYNLAWINTATEPIIPDTFQAILIVKPKIPFTETQKMKLDQYVMNGGKILWLVDRLEAEMDSLQLGSQRVVAYDRNLNIEDLLFRYGVRINPDLLMDLQSDFLPFGVNANNQFEFLHWNYFPLFESPSNHVINKNLGLVSGRFVNTIDTIKVEGIQKTILLASSENCRTITGPALISPNENRNTPEDAAFKQRNLPAAVLLEGKFTSLYANRMPAAMADSFAYYGQPVRSSSEPNRMIVVSDGDIVLNSLYQGQPLPMGMNFYTVGTQYEYPFANREFIQNCLEYLVNSSGLMEAKSKDYVLRVLDKRKTENQRFKWQLINILVPILIVALFGFFYQWYRRRKFAY